MGRQPAIPTDPSFSPLSYWYQALRDEVGICVRTTDRELFRRRLYQARLKAKDETLETLSIQFSPEDPSQVWIVKSERMPK